MLRLTKVELRRLLHRRAVLVLLAACVVIPTLIGIGVAYDTRPPSDEDRAAAQAQLDRDRTSGDTADSLRNCVRHPDDWGLPVNLTDQQVQQQCEEMTQPQLDWYLWTQPLDLEQQREEGSGIFVVLAVAMLMLVVGTTFAGHDWSSGSVSNQVLFEPRRGRIWAAKAVALAGVAGVVAAVVHSGYWLVLDALAGHRGERHGGALLMDCLQLGWRASVITALAAVMGFALTMFFRSTVATLGIVFGVALAGGMVLAIIGVTDAWNPALNLWAIVSNGVNYHAEVACPGANPGGEQCFEERTLTLARGAAYAGVVVLAVGITSLLSFRRRDVA
ncbi:hypothetical protein [Nocardioides daejeonensis]|uniref:hypothetical protein n=1 Tax=Nocardioides daejeonensis TaxID=1046556 RepID=UPI000D74302B|nr:hypothetical protein [Nocardioides daejeonensis]